MPCDTLKEIHVNPLFYRYWLIFYPSHNNFTFNLYISAIAIDHDSLFKKDQDILVLPLDSVRFDTHEKLTQDVLKHFGKV